MKRGAILWVGAAAVLGLLAVVMTVSTGQADAAEATVGTVTYLSGKGLRIRGGVREWNSLGKGSELFQGDRLKTEASSRLEATLKNGSILRLGENSDLHLRVVSGQAERKGPRRVRAKLLLGRAWAAVTKLLGVGQASFEVETPNAVAGVRGTRFQTAVDKSGSTTVKVYSGKVLVSNRPSYAVRGHTKSKRVQVAGPQEISKTQWEEMVASAMQMIRVAAGGEMAQPTAFALADPASDDFERWNIERDKAARLTE